MKVEADEILGKFSNRSLCSNTLVSLSIDPRSIRLPNPSVAHYAALPSVLAADDDDDPATSPSLPKSRIPLRLVPGRRVERFVGCPGSSTH